MSCELDVDLSLSLHHLCSRVRGEDHNRDQQCGVPGVLISTWVQIPPHHPIKDKAGSSCWHPINPFNFCQDKSIVDLVDRSSSLTSIKPTLVVTESQQSSFPSIERGCQHIYKCEFIMMHMA
jgi:hypothetical protein